MIQSSWKRYFEDPDEGLGTTYERFILHRYFRRFESRFQIRSLLEVPSFGMTGVSGINSLWWAAQGIPVTLVDGDGERIQLIRGVWEKLLLPVQINQQPKNGGGLPFEDRSFDMSWNFAALRFVDNPERIITEMTRVTKKAILICNPNPWNLFRIIDSRTVKQTSGGRDKHSASKLVSFMKRKGWKLEEQGYFDTPPWPDIAMKKEDLLKKLGLKTLAAGIERKKKSPLCIVDYFSGKERYMEEKIMKFSFLENAPQFFRRIWAHHQYFLFIRPSDRN